MKVVLLGVHKPWASSNLMADALVELGYDTVYLNYRDTESLETMPKCDLAILCKGNPQLHRSGLNMIEKQADKKVLFWMDTFNNWRPINDVMIKDLGWPFTATSMQVVRAIAAKTGNNKGVRIPQGHYGPPQWNAVETLTDQATDKRPLFFGSVNGKRREVLAHLFNKGIHVLQLPKYTWGFELQRKILEHRVVLGINSTKDVISARCQTVVAMGGAILQEFLPELQADYAGHPKHPSLKKPVMGWRTKDELFDKIKDIQNNDGLWRGADTEFAQWVRKKFNWKRIMPLVIDHATS